MNDVRRTARELQPIERVTRRQGEVLQLIAEGKTTREIAQILGISVPADGETRSARRRRRGPYAIRSGVIEPHK